MAALIKFETL